MRTTPGRRADTAYLVRAGSALVAFVHTKFNWIRTHWCVIAVACPVDGCGAKIGEPCWGDDGPHAWTHYVRRREAKKLKDEVSKSAVLGVALSVDALQRGAFRSAAARAKNRQP